MRKKRYSAVFYVDTGDVSALKLASHHVDGCYDETPNDLGESAPDSFTHGTSEQRMRWFKRGLQTGDLREGNTFEAERL